MNRAVICKTTRAALVGALVVGAFFLSAAQQATRAADNTVELDDLITESSQAPGMRDDNSQAVKIAVIDSQKAFDSSKEGRRITSSGSRISKKALEKEIQRIRNEMIDIVNGIAKERGYSLIFDLKTSGIIGYYPPTEDITDELIRRYDLSK